MALPTQSTPVVAPIKAGFVIPTFAARRLLQRRFEVPGQNVKLVRTGYVAGIVGQAHTGVLGEAAVDLVRVHLLLRDHWRLGGLLPLPSRQRKRSRN